MLGTQDLWLFIFSGIVLNITPGADSLFIATRAASQGFRAGVFATAGVSVGCYVHILAAAIGLSAILVASSEAFTVLKWVGAAYLIYLGISMWRTPSSARDDPSASDRKAASLKSIFLLGFLTSALNPKVALFFLAFVPQFIQTTAPHKALAFLFLGGLFSLSGTVWCLLLAWAVARTRRLRFATGTMTWFRRSVGGIFVVLGARLALFKQG